MSSGFSPLFGYILALNERLLKGWRMEWATMEFRNVEMLCFKTHICYISYGASLTLSLLIKMLALTLS